MGSDKWKKKKGKGKKISDGGGGKDVEKVVVNDARFASVHTDPRFQRIPTRERKVTIDSRFDNMFTDRSFGSSAAPVDKRGRRKEKQTENQLKRYYELEDEKDSDEEDKEEKVRVKVADESEEEEAVKSSDDESEEFSDTEVDTDDDDEIMLGASASDSDEQEEKVPEIDQETSRLAAVNLDWHHFKAVDLYALMNSFLPNGGRIQSVTVYPSEFGIERMKEEAVHGPIGLFDDEDKRSTKKKKYDEQGSDSDVQIENAGSENDSGSDGEDYSKDVDDNSDMSEDGNEDFDLEDEEEVDEEEAEDDEDKDYIAEKVRTYEKTRLRYYFAVVCCDSIATANHLYTECDGIEIMQSSNKLDLRFIPDAMEFKQEARDIATELPSDYEPLDFFTKALQLSKPVLTWDEDEPERATLKRNFNADELEKLEFNEFMASYHSDSDDDDRIDNKHLAKKPDNEALRSLLLGACDEDDENDGDDDGLDMEVTFNTGLEDISKRFLERREKESLTVWEEHLRKRREKRKAKKALKDSENESDDVEGTDGFFGDGPPLKKHKSDAKTRISKKGKDSIEVDKEAASRAELELLVADDKGTDCAVKGYKIKPEKTTGKKKGKEVVDEQKLPEADLNDPRFQSLFKNPLFALDPTDPQFKRSVAYRRQLADRQKKADQVEALPAEDDTKLSNETQLPSVNSSSKPVISSLVKSIKMKSKEADKRGKSNMSLAALSLKTKTKHLLK